MTGLRSSAPAVWSNAIHIQVAGGTGKEQRIYHGRVALTEAGRAVAQRLGLSLAVFAWSWDVDRGVYVAEVRSDGRFVAATKDLDAMKKAVEDFQTVFRTNLLAEAARQQLLAEPIPDGICRE